MSLRVLYTTQYLEIKRGGGESMIAKEISQAAATSSYLESFLLCPGEKTEILPKDDIGLTRVTVDSNNSWLISLNRSNPLAIYKIFQILDSLDLDIVHAQDLYPISLIAQIWAISRNIPVVRTLHVLPTQVAEFSISQNKKMLSSLVNIPIKTYVKTLMDTSDAIVALNDSAKKDMEKLGSYNIKVVPNGRNLSKYKPSSFPSIDDGVLNLLFVGWISSRKNQMYLLDMLRFLPKGKFRLIFAGDYFDDGIKNEVESFLKRYGSESVDVLGFVDHKDLPKYYYSSHFFVSASLKEVQSLVVMEALASGTPVVGLRNETMDDLIVNGFNGFCFEKNTKPKDFAKELENIVKSLDKDKYEDMCLNGISSVQRYDWSTVIYDTYRVYLDTISSCKGVDNRKRFRDILEVVQNKGVRDLIYDWYRRPVLKKEIDRTKIWGMLGIVGVLASVIGIGIGVSKVVRRKR